MTRSSPTRRAAQSVARYARLVASGVCAWPGACPSPGDPAKRTPVEPPHKFCPKHRARSGRRARDGAA